MEVTGRQFQDLTNAPQTRRRDALRNLKQGASGIALTTKRGVGTAESIRVQTYLQQSADSLCSNCTQHSKDSSQRHSRRQHRRRVAQIVAEQWKWFTKDQKAVAVASRHHKHRLLLSATLALQKYAKHQQLEWRRAAIFNHRRQYMLQGKCLLLWQAQLNNSKRVQQQLAKATAARRQTQLQQSLTCWKQYIAYKQRRRKADLQAKYYRSFVLLSSALQQWRVAAQALTQKRRRNQSAVALCNTRQLSTAFHAWLLGIEMQQQAQQAQQQAKEHHRTTLLPRVMKHWHDAVRLLHEARMEGSAAMQVVAGRLQQDRVRTLLQDWQAATRVLQSWHQLKASARLQCTQRLLTQTLHRWRTEVQYRSHLAQVSVQLVPVRRRLHLHTAWQTWASAYQTGMQQYWADMRQVVLLRACFRFWRESAALEAAQQGKLNRARKIMQATFLWRCLQAWVVAAYEQQQRHLRKHMATDFHQHRLLSHALQQWQLSTRWSKDVGWKEDLAFEHRSNTLLLKSLAGWDLAVAGRRQRLMAARWRQKQLLMACVHGWESHTAYKAEQELLRRRAVRHRYFAILRHALQALAHNVAHQHGKRQYQQQLLAVRHTWLSKQVWHAWLQDFVPVARQRRQAAARAAMHRRQHVLQTGLLAWKEVAIELADLGAKKRQAESHKRKGTLRLAFAAWYDWLGVHLAKIVAEHEQKIYLKALLHRHIRRRALKAWQEVYAALVVKHFQRARAKAMHHAHMGLRALSCWAAFVRHQQHKRAICSAATGFRRRVLLRQALQGWRAVGSQAKAKSARALAARHYCHTSSMLKSFAAWRQQAQAAVAGLVLAAPYAWHWRNLTLRTKHSSQSMPLQHSSGRPMSGPSADLQNQGQNLIGISLQHKSATSSSERELQQVACTASQHSSDRQMAKQQFACQSSSCIGDCLWQYSVSPNPHSRGYMARNSSRRHAGIKGLGTGELGEAVVHLPRPIPSVRPAKQQQQHQQHSMRSGACSTQQVRGDDIASAVADSPISSETARAHDPAMAQHVQHATAKKIRPQPRRRDFTRSSQGLTDSRPAETQLGAAQYSPSGHLHSWVPPTASGLSQYDGNANAYPPRLSEQLLAGQEPVSCCFSVMQQPEHYSSHEVKPGERCQQQHGHQQRNHVGPIQDVYRQQPQHDQIQHHHVQQPLPVLWQQAQHAQHVQHALRQWSKHEPCKAQHVQRQQTQHKPWQQMQHHQKQQPATTHSQQPRHVLQHSECANQQPPAALQEATASCPVHVDLSPPSRGIAPCNVSNTMQHGLDCLQSTEGVTELCAALSLSQMEAVLAEFRELQAQISAAECQLSTLQAGAMPSVQSAGSDTVIANSRMMGLHAHSPDAHADAKLLAVTQRLVQLKQAAVKQRPAVEAVAQQLRHRLLHAV